MGRLDDAERLAQFALDLQPNNTDALLLLGTVLDRKKRPSEAIPVLLRAAQLDPACYQSRLLLSIAFRATGQFADALGWAQDAIALDGAESRGQNQLGLCYLSLRDWDSAIICFSNAIRMAPEVAVIHSNLGQAFQGAGKDFEAAQAYSQSLAIQPRQINVLGRLATLFITQLQHEAAAECARQMLEIDSFSASGNILLATALMAEGRIVESNKYAKRAAKFGANDPEIIARYGSILQVLGQLDDADEQFKKSLELNPNQGHAYRGLTRNRKIREEDRPMVEQMFELSKRNELGIFQASDLEYALGKAREDLREFEVAMSHFDKANRLAREGWKGSLPYIKENVEERYEGPRRNFDAAFIEKYRNVGSASPLPIFVTGMMRSGTTLTEQILSSHPLIGGAGEQVFWESNHSKAFDAPGYVLNPFRLRALCDQYCNLLQSICPGKQRVVDKMTDNFNYLGFLLAAFPQGRLIHLKRNPVDTCLSIWTTPNRTPIEWVNDKANIVFTYRMYLRLAEHWRSILPADRYMEIQYEELVAEPERITRELISFCGMEWDDACLRPQDNSRAVATPSLWQVRQPVYKTSTERWRNYEPWLGEFAELIDLIGLG